MVDQVLTHRLDLIYVYFCVTGQYTAVADDPETLRVKKNMNTISNVAYHGELSRKQEMENARPAEVEGIVIII